MRVGIYARFDVLFWLIPSTPRVPKPMTSKARVEKTSRRRIGFSCSLARGISCRGISQRRRTGTIGMTSGSAGIAPNSTRPCFADGLPGSSFRTDCKQYTCSLNESTRELIQSQYSGLDWSARSRRVSKSRALACCPWWTAWIASLSITSWLMTNLTAINNRKSRA